MRRSCCRYVVSDQLITDRVADVLAFFLACVGRSHAVCDNPLHKRSRSAQSSAGSRAYQTATTQSGYVFSYRIYTASHSDLTLSSGLDEDEALHQYVVYDTAKTKGPRRINLDDPSPSSAKTYAPPSSLSVHLSKIDMPELQPRPDTQNKPDRMSTRPRPSPTAERPTSERSSKESRPSPKAKERERERLREQEREKEREKERARELEKARKKAEKEAKKAKKGKSRLSAAVCQFY